MTDHPQEPAEQSFTIQEVREQLKTLQELSDEELDTLVTGGGLAHILVNVVSQPKAVYQGLREGGVGRAGSAVQAAISIPSAIGKGLKGDLVNPAQVKNNAYIASQSR